jgi:hypothetical protein
MPAKSRAQQRFFGMCLHQPRHARGQCPDLPRKAMETFAATKHTALPERVRRRQR